MHKLLNYACDELEELERKADKGKLSMTEIQYADMLAHLKKNLLTADAMENPDEYSNDGGNSYARGRYAKRDSMGRYSREGSYRDGSYDDNYSGRYSREDAKDYMMSHLRSMENRAQDEQSRNMVRKWMKQAEEM